MNDRIIIVGEHGSYRMLLSQQWMLEAHKRGLRDPWQHRPDKPIRYEEVIHKLAGTDFEMKGQKPIYNDYTEDELSAWKVERNEYMRQRDEWTALQMFHKFGYEVFLAECKIYGLTETFKNSVFPCESGGLPQCTIFCPIYKDCALRLNGEGTPGRR